MMSCIVTIKATVTRSVLPGHGFEEEGLTMSRTLA